MPPATRPVASTSSSDAVIETQVFWMRYRMHIIAGLAIMLGALAAYGGYRYYSARREAAASALLAGAKGAADYQQVISQYPGAAAAGSAHLLLAEAQRKEQKLAEANTTLQGFVDKNPKHEFVATAQMAMAGNLESLGKADEALQLYGRIAADHPQSFNAPLALLAQVHILKQKGQVDEARRVCETVLAQYRDSYTSQEATRYLRTLKPAAATTPTTAPAPPAAETSAAPTP
jgi:predicted negative regulator of RcsB-dependent stress response